MTDIVFFAVVLAGVLVLLKAYLNIYAVQVRKTDLAYKELPGNFEGFTILHLTDLHITKWGKMEDKLLSILQNNPVDVVVVTGDLATTQQGIEPFCKLLQSAKGRYGVFISFGNTEHKYWESEDMIRIFQSAGARVLKNESVTVEKDGQVIEIAGVDDPFTGHARLSKAVAGVPEDRFKILLGHSPTIATEAAEKKISLLLSGHTHGGQVRLPFIGAIKTHLPHQYRQLAMGLVDGDRLSRIIGLDAGDLKVYVSRGVGTSYLPIRLLCPPEIPLYTLHKA